jgi:isorenieratene synthase
MGNPEGLVFDVLDEPFSTAVWDPFRRYLESLGVEMRLGRAVERVERERGGAFRLGVEGQEEAGADGLVLALDVAGLQAVVASSPDLGEPSWRRSVAALAQTLPFAVWRLWLDGPLEPGRAPFAATAGCGLLDNISAYHRFQGESRRWAEARGGSVVELHAYALPEDMDEARIRPALWEPFTALYPEVRQLRVLDERFLLRRDCPAFAPATDPLRPTVETPDRCLALAGDFVRLPFPTALMERAVASGFLAANTLLATWGVAGEPIRHVATRGWLAR